MPDAPAAKPAAKTKTAAAAPAPAKPPEPKEDPKVAIPKLIAQLQVEGLDQKEKRKIRMRLRKLGHFGGANRLGDGGTEKPAPKAKAAPAPAAATPAKAGGRRAAV